MVVVVCLLSFPFSFFALFLFFSCLVAVIFFFQLLLLVYFLYVCVNVFLQLLFSLFSEPQAGLGTGPVGIM